VRGHGKTDTGDGQYTIDGHVDDLFNLLQVLKIKKCVIVGLSMGGYIALRAVERNQDLFSGLVLCDTRSEADTNEGKIRRHVAAHDVKKNGVTDIFADDYIKGVFSQKSILQRPQAVAMIRNTIKETNPFGMAGNFIALAARTDTTESLSKIIIPTLILVGENDIFTPPALSKSMHERVRNSELLIIPEAGHISNLENPSVFNEKLLQFLDRIDLWGQSS
jgi:3-oxoadipate enol-lactonase